MDGAFQADRRGLGFSVQRRTILLSTIAAVAVPSVWSKAADDGREASFDAYVRTTMAKWGVPGAAIATVTNGNVVRAKGYGVKTAGGADSVGSNTVFAIASLTKAFTAATLATLVDEKRLDWDDPVAKFIPELSLHDAKVTSTVTVRDLVDQRTCLQSKDLFTWGSPFNKQELIRRLKFLKPACAFRSAFVYNNLNFVLAGEVAARAGGAAWEELVQARVLTPLGMRSSTPVTAQAAGSTDLATPHIRTGGRLRTLKLYDEGVSAAAGSIHSTAGDMARWLEVCLGGGRMTGQRLWSLASNQQLFGDATLRDLPASNGEGPALPESTDYRCGWGRGIFRGRRYFEHTGQSDGMYAFIAFMPDEGCGIAVMTNTSMVGLPQALAYRWLDATLRLPPTDWPTVMFDQSKDQNNSIDLDGVVRSVPRKSGTHPSLPVAAYSGTYQNDLLGDAILSVGQDGRLSIKILARTGTLTHWDDDRFQIDWGGDPFYTMVASFLRFEIGASKAPTSLVFGSDEDVFVRRSSS